MLSTGKKDVTVCSDADSLQTRSSVNVMVVNVSNENKGEQLCICKGYVVKF